MTWDGIVTTYHRRHSKELNVDKHMQAYIKSWVLSGKYDFRPPSHRTEWNLIFKLWKVSIKFKRSENREVDPFLEKNKH